MQYYVFELDEESQELCTIATLFGLYKSKRLPMGINISPDIAQDAIEKVLHNINDVKAYIDDIGCFSSDWETHIALLDKVLSHLEATGFILNPCKCEWGIQETNWLSHWLTPNGIKPWKKKWKPWCRCNAHVISRSCIPSLARYSGIETCGLEGHTHSHC